MRRAAFFVLMGLLVSVATPAFAANKCEKMAEEPPADRPRISLLNWPEFVIHSFVSIETDATQPDGTGTAKLYGPIAHASEVENFYVALLRDRGWKLAQEYQPANQHVFIKKDRRITLTSEADLCMGYLLTLHAVPFDASKYAPTKPMAVKLNEKLNEKIPGLEKPKKKKPELPEEIRKLPHNVAKEAAEKAEEKAAAEKEAAAKAELESKLPTSKPDEKKTEKKAEEKKTETAPEPKKPVIPPPPTSVSTTPKP